MPLPVPQAVWRERAAMVNVDLLDLRSSTSEGSTQRPGAEALVCSSGAGTPVNSNNWRARVCRPATEATGLSWATPYTGRHSYISLEVHAGTDPVGIAKWAGSSAAIIWKHYARESERSHTAERLALARRRREAVVAGRRAACRSAPGTRVRVGIRRRRGPMARGSL